MPQPAPDARWRPHLTRWLAYLKLSRGCWLVVDEMCRRQGGSRAVVRAGALSLSAATGVSERQVYRVLRAMIDLGLLEPEWLGGGSKNPGGAGLATEYRLGQRARRQPGSPHLAVLKKGDIGDTLPGRQKGDIGDTLPGDQKGDTGDTPDMRKYDSLRSSSSADKKDGPAGPDYEPLIASGSPAVDAYLAERRAQRRPAEGPPTVPGERGAIGDLLATPLTRPEINLDLPPPKRRR